MSRARVLLDAALQLGDGSRSGAAEVLAEAFVADPALLRAALALASSNVGVRQATRIATAWTDFGEGLWRYDALRRDPVARVYPRTDYTGAQVWDVGIWVDGQHRPLGTCPTVQVAQATADTALTDEEALRRWHLL